MTQNSPVLVTGVAGFIGFHVARTLLKKGRTVVGLDNLNEYYDVNLKHARLEMLRSDPRFEFVKIDLADRLAMSRLFAERRFPYVINLAAQAGVRYSLDHPEAYIESNLAGFTNVLEGCRRNGCQHLLFASSSSVYGTNTKMPFSEHDNVDHPISLYAATKKANELMAHAYSHLFELPTTGLRFFTVYGPWGRPDMAMFIFAKAISEGRPINLFNHGQMRRDFTYVDDVVEAIIRLIDKIPQRRVALPAVDQTPATSAAPWRIYNIGNNRPEELMRVVELIEQALGRTAIKNMLPMQPGDVSTTFADVEDLARDIGFQPKTSLEHGIREFIQWYTGYYAP